MGNKDLSKLEKMHLKIMWDKRSSDSPIIFEFFVTKRHLEENLTNLNCLKKAKTAKNLNWNASTDLEYSSSIFA